MLKRTFIILALFIGAVTGMSLHTEADYRTGIGRDAPGLSITQADRELLLDEMRGRYVLLNFWCSNDAPSRVATNLYSGWARNHPEADVELLSVNFDESEGLFRELLRRDGIESSTQFNVQGEQAAAIRRNYALGNGYGSVLINPQGKIVAHNPTPEQLTEMFG